MFDRSDTLSTSARQERDFDSSDIVYICARVLIGFYLISLEYEKIQTYNFVDYL
jgi:hypothetical protein